MPLDALAFPVSIAFRLSAGPILASSVECRLLILSICIYHNVVPTTDHEESVLAAVFWVRLGYGWMLGWVDYDWTMECAFYWSWAALGTQKNLQLCRFDIWDE